MPYINNFHLIRETCRVQEVWFLNDPYEQIHSEENERSNAFKREVLEALTKLRDALQDYINKCQLLFSESQSLDDESRSELMFYQDLEEVRQEMISLVETMKKIKEEYNAEDLKTSNKDSPLANEDFGGNKALYIRGVNDEEVQQLINRVMGSDTDIISVVGMAGIG
ncbi:hypothetical protein ACJIZ3_009353 [Penstemon smallii]|uniref:Uncharacterized protein n=1 Tax=Penstemon smallii TaxID=265156 RepID=A0ABD3TC96_9LAMI